MVSLDASFDLVYIHIKSSGNFETQTPQLKIRNFQLNTRPELATSHYFIYRNDRADLMYYSIKPAHDP